MNLFDSISKEQFLAEYWEKRPFVFRSVLTNDKHIISEDDLRTMLQDDYYETRYIGQSDQNWQVLDGPFDKLDHFEKQYSTYCIHNTELYVPAIKSLTKSFDFIPGWLFDDVMCTYSSKDSSVGAHIDNYNVFILQASGTREWQLQTNPNPNYQEGLPVKILEEFHPDETIELHPGDIIYIPPHIAHHGVTKEESISLSFGYKSLEKKALLDRVALNLLEKFDSDEFFKFENLAEIGSDMQVSAALVQKIKKELIRTLDENSIIENALMEFISYPKKFPEENDILSYEDFLETTQNMNLYKDEFVRSAFLSLDDNSQFYINTAKLELSTQEAITLNQGIAKLDSTTPVSKSLLSAHSEILYRFYLEGILYFSE